jgi:hypothetical protein
MALFNLPTLFRETPTVLPRSGFTGSNPTSHVQSGFDARRQNGPWDSRRRGEKMDCLSQEMHCSSIAAASLE